MAHYQTTRWSLVQMAGDEGVDGRNALGQLLEVYRPVIESRFRREHIDGVTAEDLCQEFFVRAIQDDFFSKARSEKGSLRAYLKTAVERFVLNQKRNSLTEKRGSGARHETEEELVDVASSQERPDQNFDRLWAQGILNEALKRLRNEDLKKGKVDLFDALAPFLSEDADRKDYVEIAARFQTRPNTIAVAVSRLRDRFQKAVRTLVADTVSDSGQLDDELSYLRDIAS